MVEDLLGGSHPDLVVGNKVVPAESIDPPKIDADVIEQTHGVSEPKVENYGMPTVGDLKVTVPIHKEKRKPLYDRMKKARNTDDTEKIKEPLRARVGGPEGKVNHQVPMEGTFIKEYQRPSLNSTQSQSVTETWVFSVDWVKPGEAGGQAVRGDSMPSQPINPERFTITAGKRELPLHQADLGSKSVNVVEHNTGGTKQRHTTKHVESVEYGGRITLTMYAKGSKTSIDDWLRDMLDWKESASIRDVSVNVYNPKDEMVARWEYTDTRLVTFQYQSISDGEMVKIEATLHYRDAKRKKP